MSRSAIRTIACAGALATGLMLASPVAAWADEDGADGSAMTEFVAPTGGDTTDAGGGDEGSPDSSTGPTSTVGNGRTGEPSSEAVPVYGGDASRPRYAGDGRPKSMVNGFVIPVLRIPTYEEFMTPGGIPPGAFFGTVEVPTLDQMFRAMAQPQPEPEPAPGPAFRTQQEDAPPVVDAVGAPTGGSDGVAGAQPPVYEAPVVIFAQPPAAIPRPAPRGEPAPTLPVTAGVQPAAAGVRAPLIRGTLPPSKVTPPNSTSPLSNGTTTAQAGYPRYLRNPTVGELAAVALPGVAGLLFLTFSGGVIGYRQANSTRFVRADAARFLS